ncbi:hypothetical protein GP486_002681 [Trichoglossum hirsutum]|uniref:Uncharacterized protein n=1 Tax=Trichoglossum hirsutum TaxID=265104 RepID=A0A9P8LEH2_9PEZI|nr:hypothetical protein GP486_002681 [Trichoglossum hirsutum]
MLNNTTIGGSTVNNATLGNLHASVIGWVSGPKGRGSVDIMWGSFLAIFLCTWTAVCLNIPHPKDSKFKILRRKTKWMIWAIIGPELVLSVAIGQYASARRSVKRFRKLGYPQWTLRHAFFADMGGIILKPKDSTPFVVNARQLVYLIEKNYLEFPTITAEEIWNMSKADTLSKLLTLLQASWLVLQLVGRAILRLATSTLELSAAAIVFCTFGTFVCWLQKPSDVTQGIVLESEATTEQILRDAGEKAAAPYKHTPLDFVAKESFTVGYDVMGFFNLRCDDRERPLQRFSNDRFPDISTIEKFALFCWTTAYAAFHLIAWHWMFPTTLESLLWRIASLIITGTTVSFWVFETIAARQRFGRWDKYLIWLRLKKPCASDFSVDEEAQEDPRGDDVAPSALASSGKDKVKAVARLDTIHRLDAFEEEQKNAKPMLAWEVAIIFFVTIFYATARAYMILEVFISMRKMPLGVYQTVEWIQVLPHW